MRDDISDYEKKNISDDFALRCLADNEVFFQTFCNDNIAMWDRNLVWI